MNLQQIGGRQLSTRSGMQLCLDLLPKVSRSFALAIAALNEPERDYICIAYLLCRIVDTIEDHPTLSNKQEHFEEFDYVLNHLDLQRLNLLPSLDAPQSWDRELMENSQTVFQEYANFPKPIVDILRKHVGEMSFGMREYTVARGDEGIELKDDSDLDRYCYYVAGTVGNLLTDTIAQRLNRFNTPWHQRQLERGYHFALGLQKVNMIKDVVQDLQRGSLFVPQTWLNIFDVNAKDLFRSDGSVAENDPKLRRLLLHFISQALNHFKASREYILDIPAESYDYRMFCIWPYVMAIDTLTLALSQKNLFTKDHVIKVSRKDMYRMMSLSAVAARVTPVLSFYLNQKIQRLENLLEQQQS